VRSVRVWVRQRIPVRVWLVWYALLGRPILYRATLGFDGTRLPSGSLIGGCRFVMDTKGMSVEPGRILVVGTLDIP
jgi:hypothetical protein